MKQSAVSRRKFFASVADTDTLILPIHFPRPTVGLIKADGDRFNFLALDFCLRQYVFNHPESRRVASTGFDCFARRQSSAQ